MTHQPRILFVSHDASATGAPQSLLNFLDWNVRHQRSEFRILLLKPGPLVDEFARRGPTTVIRDPDRPVGTVRRVVRGVARRIGRGTGGPAWVPEAVERRAVTEALTGFHPDLIYVNSVAAAPVLAYVDAQSRPVLTFVRELAYEVERARATGYFERLASATTVFVSVSEASKAHLVDHAGISPDRFAVINTFVDTARLDASRGGARQTLLDLAGDASVEFVIAGCGGMSWRKGVDLFVSIARSFFDQAADDRVVFVWVGEGPAHEYKRLEYDIAQAGLHDRLRLVGGRRDAAALVASADVLAMTSRDDPYPRVMLEASLGGCPTVCFEGSGGASEFVSKGAGVSVPYLSIGKFAAALRSFRGDDAARRAVGDRARAIVLQDHDVEGGAARIFGVIERTLADPASGGPLGARARDGAVR